jgi:PAS domain S-box-containing protein
MSDKKEMHDHQDPEVQQQRFVVTATTIIAALMAVVTAVLFYLGEEPDNKVVAAMLLPILISAIQARRKKPTQAVWILGASFWVGLSYLVYDNPQTPFEVDDLVGRYIFPVIAVVPIALFGLKSNLQKASVAILSVTVSALAALYGYVNDPTISQTSSPFLLGFLYVLVAVTFIGFAVVIYRSFPNVIKAYLNQSLRFKFILVMTIVLMVVVSAVTTLMALRTRQALLLEASNRLDVMAQAEATQIEQYLLARVESMQIFAGSGNLYRAVNPYNDAYTGSLADIENQLLRLDEQWVNANDNSQLVQGALSGLLPPYLHEYLELHPDFFEAFITDKYGGLVAAAARTSDYYQADEGWWQAAYNNGAGAVYVGQPEFDDSAGAIGANVAVPIYGEGGREVVGIFRTTLSLDPLLETIGTEESFTEAMSSEVVFAEIQSHYHAGEAEAHEEGETHEEHEAHASGLVAVDAAEWELVESGIERSTVLTESTAVSGVWDGESRYISLAPISGIYFEGFKDLEWYGMVTQTEESVNAPVQRQVLTAVLIAIIIEAVGVVVAGYAAQMFVSPILGLTDVAREFAFGNLAVRTDVTSEDEIGTLAGTFNQMADEVAERTQETEAALGEARIMYEVGQAVSAASSFDDLLEDMYETLTRHGQFLNAHELALLTIEADETGYPEWGVIRHTVISDGGKPVNPIGTRFRLGDFPLLNLWADNPGTALLIEDVKNDERCNEELKRIFQHLNQNAIMVVPLAQAGEWLAIVTVNWQEEKRFSRQEERLAEALIPTMTTAVANLLSDEEVRAALYEVGTRQTELEASQRVTFAASERTTPEDLLNLVVNLIRDQFNLYHAQVYMLDDQKVNAVLRESTGYAGRMLLQRKHHIPVERASLVTQAIKTGEAVLVAETAKDPNWLPNELLPETQSELVVPLIMEGEVLGVLDIQSRDAGYFTERSVPLFQQMMNQIAFLFENADLVTRITNQTDNLQRFSNQLQAAAEIATRINTILDRDELLNEAVHSLQSRFGFYHAHIYLVDTAANKLTVQAGSGSVGAILRDRKHSIDLDNPSSIVARCARERRPVSVSDTTKEEGFMQNPLLPNTRSEVAIPLAIGDQMFGVLDLQDEVVDRFSDADVATLATLGGQLASSLESARLFEEQAAAEERFRALFENVPLGFVLTDLGSGTFEQVNPAFGQMIGYTVDELNTLTYTDLTPEKWYKTDERIIEQLNTVGEYGPVEKEYITKDGRVLSVELRGVAVDDPSGKRYAWSSIQDVSERKEYEHGLVQTDRLKSEFLANMSHELRTPLNSIIGYTDVLLMGLDGELDPETLTDVQAIHDNSQTLLRIINDILDLAKIEAGRMILELSDVDVKAVLEDVKKSNAGLLVNKPVALEVDVKGKMPKLTVDPIRLNQILNNLVSNAVKFTEKGSITMRAFTEDKWMVLQVEDTGVGIKEEDIEVIFEEFQQADGSASRAVEGTGLGLAITKSLAELHGGKIVVESEFGKGSTFSVYLPLESKVSPGVTVIQKDGKNGSKKVVV